MLIKSRESKSRRALLKKYGKVNIDTNFLRGEICVVGYRKYNLHEEIDVEFRGSICARIGYSNSTWYTLEDIQKPHFRVSIVKLNRFFRKYMLESMDSKLKYFSVSLRTYSNIKKIKWVS